MKILLLSRSCTKAGSADISLPLLAGLVLLLLSSLSAAGLWAGYRLGLENALLPSNETGELDLASRLHQQQRELQDMQMRTREHLDALALRLGLMQSHVLRLDTLGERLTRLGNLDADEFGFDQPPARGGLDAADTAQSVNLIDLLEEMKILSYTLEDRRQKLGLLEDLLMNRQLQQEVHPTGRPVKKSWISSRYGYRKDPFTGKRAFHRGVDIAGKRGANVVAVASGIVTWAGEKSGFGGLLEINHGNGYVTRYGHNESLLVSPGDTVSKGQEIATVGSSGRSTGPHVHFEVEHNGKNVNPAKYLDMAR